MRENCHAIFRNGHCVAHGEGSPSILMEGETITYYKNREDMLANAVIAAAVEEQTITESFVKESGHDRSQVYAMKARQAEKYLEDVDAGMVVDESKYSLLFAEHDGTKDLTGWTIRELAERILNNAVGRDVIDREVKARRVELHKKHLERERG